MIPPSEFLLSIWTFTAPELLTERWIKLFTSPTNHLEYRSRTWKTDIWWVPLQVPLGLAIVWAYAFLLTQTGKYDYKGCNLDHPPRNGTVILPFPANCTDQIFTQTQCRTDISHALSKSSWFRVPYPFQWGSPSFDWRTGVIMIAASVIASVDSVISSKPAEILCCPMFLLTMSVNSSISLLGVQWKHSVST